MESSPVLIMKLNQVNLPYLFNSTELLIKLRKLGGLAALESSNKSHENGAWSIISAAPYKSIIIKHGDSHSDLGSKLKNLHQLLPKTESDLPFTGGIIGHCAYDLGIPSDFQLSNHFENQEQFLAGLYTWAFLFNHQKMECTLVHWSDISRHTLEELTSIYKDTEAQRTNFKLSSPFTPLWNRPTYQGKIEHIQSYINAGDTYQVNLAQCFKGTYAGNPILAYEKLKQKAQVPFACYFEGSDFQFCSASPELFISSSDSHVSTKPIKGTRPRGTTPTEDEYQKTALKQSKKDQAENLMIVDLLRNDLSRHSSKIEVSDLFNIESFSTVHHLVSTIHSELKDPQDILKLFLSALPGGSITGAPKKRSMEIIQELEEQPRSFYCGSTFYWSSNQRFSSNILIRSFLFQGNDVYCWGGGGIVADSIWEDEYQESLDKVSRLMESLSE